MHDTVYAVEYTMCYARMYVYMYLFICNFMLSVSGWNKLLLKQRYIFISITNILFLQNIGNPPIFHGTVEEYEYIVQWVLRCSFSERVPSCGQRRKVIKCNTVKPVLNGISRDQNIFPLKPGFRLIKVHYIQYKKLNQDMQTLTLRWLMSYIYGAPILDVSRSHTTTQHSR